ncbi:LacI family DNA-binding transcriptional regulator [Domibacillus aminovorans]|uniref:HTH lacI-type domain-containing protein n=1 Tax=Domibacillus aminovorans TaxID=29332 RepID=A0A177L5J3_9BACI|nr:LacI family DNA-binding transcriptional regulator [Domibacillus aminovorans]OAH60572.1 hypothetical protein AWH49_15675 [Domibacillus aminovorans]
MGNIHDIARIAGVSTATVSRVLNNHPYVSDGKRLAVLNAAEQLHYEKNINAVHLSRGKTETIGVILPFVNHPYFGTILNGIASAAEKSGFKLMIVQTNYDIAQEIDALNMLKLKQVDGIIITSRECPIELVEDYSAYGNIVLCEASSGEQMSSVFVNQYEAFKEAISFFIERGHSKIGYTVFRLDGKSSQARKKAYEETFGHVQDKWIFDQALTIEDGTRVAGEWAALDDPPPAMLITNDFVAVGFILECKRLGFNVPEDVAVVGFDNHAIAAPLGITTIELPLKQLGIIAFQLAISEDTVSHREIAYKLIERDSV